MAAIEPSPISQPSSSAPEPAPQDDAAPNPAPVKRSLFHFGWPSLSSLWHSGAKATPEFKAQLHTSIATLLQETKKPFSSQSGPFATLTLSAIPRQFSAAPNTSPAEQLTRLRSLVQTLQSLPFWDQGKGAYPGAVQWTSTVLATILIDYILYTGDETYFPDFVKFYQNQPWFALTFQGYDDKQWVILTYLQAILHSRQPPHQPEGQEQGQQALGRIGGHLGTGEDKWVSRAKWFYWISSFGWDNTFDGGGMWWQPFNNYKNAVTNELWVTVNTYMYQLLGEKEKYLYNAVRGWCWFKLTGMINAQGLVNDGLNAQGMNNGQTTWTYNQIILLPGLAKLFNITGDISLLTSALSLLDSVILSPDLIPGSPITALSDSSLPILVEPGDSAHSTNQDQQLFKGIYFLHLSWFLTDITHSLRLSLPDKKAILNKYVGFVMSNAEAVWTNARGQNRQVGNFWGGEAGEVVTVETHGSGVAAVLCAVRVNQLLAEVEGMTH